MINVPITFDEAYEFIKLYDVLRDMDFELTESQQNVFEKIQAGDHLRDDWDTAAVWMLEDNNQEQRE